MKHIVFVFCVFSFFSQYAQTDLHCGTDEALKAFYKQHPEAEARQKALSQQTATPGHRSVTSVAYTIPVVFHILHIDGPENISDAQVRDAMAILNRDYAKRNADTTFIIPEFKAIADSTTIHFALATKDPSGNCTNGIIHYLDTDTDWNMSSPTLYQYTWDPTRYMNVYVVKTISLSNGFPAAGYTYFPGTFSAGAPEDAIVVLNNYLGSIGTAHSFLSRTLTHEAGHWLGLRHVFGNQGTGIGCTGTNADDLVADTPPTKGFVSCPDISDPSSYRICTPGQSENFQNYMDYSYCTNMFTKQQAIRMQNTLQSAVSGRSNLWSSTNLLSTGVTNPNTTCVPFADFKFDRSETCAGVPVVFTDASNNAQATTYNWSFPGGTPSTSSVASPTVVYNAPGLYSVSYSSGTTAGTSATVTKNSVIKVVAHTANHTAPFIQGFESHPLPGNNWEVGSSNGSVTWEQSYEASYSGAWSARLPSLGNTRFASSFMTSPLFDISALLSPMLTFKLATADLNPNHINTLKVLASTDCESTWTELYSKTGAALVTTTSTMDPFIPSALTQWRAETISLTPFLGSSHISFKFVYKRDSIAGASNVFLDDINISGTVGLATLNGETMCELFPNPASETVTLRFDYIPGLSLTVSDVFGRVVSSGDEGMQSGTWTFPVGKQSRFSPGIYFVTLQNGERTTVKKLIVN